MIRHNTIIVFLLTIVMLCILGSNCLAVEYPCEGVANSKSVRFRKKASSSGDIAGTLELGETVTVSEEIVHKHEKADLFIYRSNAVPCVFSFVRQNGNRTRDQ